jgi:hypothetical protein
MKKQRKSKNMPHQRLKPENFLDEERLVTLKNIIPEAFADNKINWSTLKNAKLASRPSKGTLIPAKGEGIKEETTRISLLKGKTWKF